MDTASLNFIILSFSEALKFLSAFLASRVLPWIVLSNDLHLPFFVHRAAIFEFKWVFREIGDGIDVLPFFQPNEKMMQGGKDIVFGFVG